MSNLSLLTCDCRDTFCTGCTATNYYASFMNLGHVQVIAYKGGGLSCFICTCASYYTRVLLTRDGKGERDGALAEELYFILAGCYYI
jgi:hypothetical protein